MRWEVVLAREVEWWLNDLARKDPRSFSWRVTSKATGSPGIARPFR